MFRIHPAMFFLWVFLLFTAGTFAGLWIRRRVQHVVERESGSLKTLESALLALLGLLLGFTFSMAVSRYDARKTLEIAEANDLGTLWYQTSLIPDPSRTQVRDLIRQYVPVRMQFLASGTSREAYAACLRQSGALQNQMWDVAVRNLSGQRDPETALFLRTLSDSISSTERRTAAFENRIPATAWGMLLFIGFVACSIVGLGLQSRAAPLRLLLPLVLAATLGLTYDLDSPRSGLIQVHQPSFDRLLHQVNGPVPQ